MSQLLQIYYCVHRPKTHQLSRGDTPLIAIVDFYNEMLQNELFLNK